MPLLSICIPCNGRIEYVKKTLDSIYKKNSDVPLELFEVIVSENDPLKTICPLIKEYQHYENIKYYYTDCEGFMNSYYVLKYANGDFLKLHNSQTIFKPGSIHQIIDDIKSHINDKGLIFYSNGVLNNVPQNNINFDNFEDFMYNLSYWSSWSNGFCIWKDELNKITELKFNKLFPHTSIFLTQHKAISFIINNKKLFTVQRIPKRGGHNKFQAFTIEYPSLINKCYEEKLISKKCKEHIIKEILTEFLPILLFNKYIARIETFESTGYRDNIKKYFPKYAYWKSWLYVFLVPFKLILRKLK